MQNIDSSCSSDDQVGKARLLFFSPLHFSYFLQLVNIPLLGETFDPELNKFSYIITKTGIDGWDNLVSIHFPFIQYVSILEYIQLLVALAVKCMCHESPPVQYICRKSQILEPYWFMTQMERNIFHRFVWMQSRFGEARGWRRARLPRRVSRGNLDRGKKK